MFILSGIDMNFLFIGEKPSRTAFERGWTWENGQLAAKQLFDALAYSEIVTERCTFVNLFGNDPDSEEIADIKIIEDLLRHDADGIVTLVAMGEKVAKSLRCHGVDHKKIVHPAARGKIRGKEIYCQHVKDVLIG
jgi:hypothetical protein